ncbi:MAG: ATP-binding cassette domain-containing protein [Methylobacteriaceae bacterium]|nr:ATP-binding cassette domain-containing protein [Methylobacteriaceae bacterium]
MTPDLRSLLVAAFGLIALPFGLNAIGLTWTSATEVVVFALACMALNVLVGQTGLVSFGHGAWFGLAAYVAGLAQRNLFPGSFVLPAATALIVIALLAAGFGALILRRRGVYFSLLTLALSAMLYVIAFRWTAVTGGENGLGGITRPVWFGLDFEASSAYYAFVAGIAFLGVLALWRFHRSPVGAVLSAIRENETRARFIGYPTNAYKLIAFTLSATLTGLAGVLLMFNNRMTSAEPISVAFSGELLAMVVIGGMRSFLGPALGALFFILFREYLSTVTENWLLWFGLLFVGFIVFSPDGLVGVAGRLTKPFRKETIDAAAMANRQAGASGPVPAALIRESHEAAPALIVEGVAKSFGGIRAVRGVSFAVADRTLHALIGPNGAGKTTAFNLVSGLFPPDEGRVTLDGRTISGLAPEAITRAGVGRSFQITSLFTALSVEENIRLAVQARHRHRMNVWRAAATLEGVGAETAELMRWTGLAGAERAEAGSLSYGGQRLLDMGLALATRPRILLLDEPLAGLAAAERGRVGDLIKTLSKDIPVLLVEHDIDRVFQIADHVTVMNDGAVLVDGAVEDARSSPEVQEVYIGSGAHAIAGKPRESQAGAQTLLALQDVHTYYGKSHILDGVSLELRDNEVIALLGRNGAGKSTLLKTIIGVAPPRTGEIALAGEPIARLPSWRIARAGVGFVPQGRGLFAGMSVRENLGLGRHSRLTGAGKHWDEERLLAFFPRLKERLDTPADYLSGGEQQMVAVARALSGDTRVLLLDEPFEGLSPAVTEELFEAFHLLRKDIAIVIVDHHLDLALALSDRTVALERGRVTHVGPSKALREDLDLRRKVLWL